MIKGCYFPEWIRCRKDEYFNFQVDKKINTLVRIQEQLYNYRLNLNSIITKNTSFKKIVNNFYTCVDLIEHNELRFAKHYIAAFCVVAAGLLTDNSHINIPKTLSITYAIYSSCFSYQHNSFHVDYKFFNISGEKTLNFIYKNITRIENKKQIIYDNQ